MFVRAVYYCRLWFSGCFFTHMFTFIILNGWHFNFDKLYSICCLPLLVFLLMHMAAAIRFTHPLDFIKPLFVSNFMMTFSLYLWLCLPLDVSHTCHRAACDQVCVHLYSFPGLWHVSPVIILTSFLSWFPRTHMHTRSFSFIHNHTYPLHIMFHNISLWYHHQCVIEYLTFAINTIFFFCLSYHKQT